MSSITIPGRKKTGNYRYSEDEALWHSANPAPSQAAMKPWKSDILSSLKKDIDQEYSAIQDCLDGKIEEPRTNIRTVKGIEYSESLYYFRFPEFFEEEIEKLQHCLGDDLRDTDIAWINNTKQLIKKYHAILFKNKTVNKAG